MMECPRRGSDKQGGSWGIWGSRVVFFFNVGDIPACLLPADKDDPGEGTWVTRCYREAREGKWR